MKHKPRPLSTHVVCLTPDKCVGVLLHNTLCTSTIPYTGDFGMCIMIVYIRMYEHVQVVCM